MSLPKSCCTPCPETETVQVPGPDGEPGTDGADGADGISAFTFTTANFVVPAIGAQVTVSVGNSSWMAVDGLVFCEGAGIFQVISIPATTSVVLEYLDYSVNTNAGATITSGAMVNPSGSEPSVSLLPSISDYETGGSQALTVTPSQLISLSVTLTEAKSYLLLAQIRLDFDAATFEADRTATVKLRRTNNTAADIANAVQAMATGVTVLETATAQVVHLPAVVYAAGAGDIIQMFGSVDTAPYSGSLKAVSGSILAIPLF